MPPTESTIEKSSEASARTPAPAVAAPGAPELSPAPAWEVSGGGTWPGSPARPAPSLTGSGPELVARVVDGRPVTHLADQPRHARTPTGFDPRDAAASQPHEVDRGRPVVQLGLERGDTVARAQDDRADDSGELDLDAV